MSQDEHSRKIALIAMALGVLVGAFLGYKILPQLVPRAHEALTVSQAASLEAAQQREGVRLTALIESLSVVDDAHVSVSLPVPGTRRPRPSAVLTVTPTAALTPAQVAGIAELALRELDGAHPGAVSVFDDEGRHLNQAAQEEEARLTFWKGIALNVAKVLGILAALITLRFVVDSIGRAVGVEADASCLTSRRR